MTRLQQIENAVASLSGAEFQELCDSLLVLRNKNYRAFSRSGSQSGKQKTIIGTPDSFLLLPNGKYIFVEYSTNVTKGLNKLKDDVSKCLDTEKTKIDIRYINEIIVCVNFKLNPEDIEELQSLVRNHYITLTVYMLDSISIDLHLQHRDLVHLYLGLPLDTGQIVSLDTFIDEYHKKSKGIATRLDNTFVHRKNELNEIKTSLSVSDFLIVTGAPGVGKTRLCLESIKSFLSEYQDFKSYCISYKNHVLLDDLHQYIDKENDYILFIDDANRIDAFSQIIGFYSERREGKLKIIITVRDYALQEIMSLCRGVEPERVDVFKFSDEQIKDIIESFGILNPDYQRPIIDIADGNPRLAIMATKLAKKKQSISALNDISELFEKYFDTFVDDDGEFTKPINIKCLGLIAFFYTLPYKKQDIIIPILSNFEIDYYDFINAIDKLDKLELVELQYEYVKIPEQNLSTFFFYKAFIEDDLLSFETLLINYFGKNKRQFNDTVIPANNMFDTKKVMNKLKPALKKYLIEIENQEKEAFDFLNTFWYYLPHETLAFLHKKIYSFPEIMVSEYKLTYNNNDYSHNNNKIIELLGNFFRYNPLLTDTLELAFEYIRRSPNNSPELVYKIDKELAFSNGDEQYKFYSQTTLYDLLLKGLEKDNILLANLFFQLSKTFLSFEFESIRGGRGNKVYFGNYPVPNIPLIQDFRKRIWITVDKYFIKYPSQAKDLLSTYPKYRRRSNLGKDLIEYDLSFIINIIQKNLDNQHFGDCFLVQELIDIINRNKITYPDFEVLKKEFTNPTYKTFLKLDWNIYRNKQWYKFDDHKEYEKLKSDDIRSSFVFKSLDEITSFYNQLINIKEYLNSDFYTSLDIVIDENFKQNFDLGCKFFNLIVENNNELQYIPLKAFTNHLNTKEKADKIWDIIHNPKFMRVYHWELSFYTYLSKNLINKNHVVAILNTFEKIQKQNRLYLDWLTKYLHVEPQLFKKVLKVIVKRNNEDTEKGQLFLWHDFFQKHFDYLEDDIEVVYKAYLQQEEIQPHFDRNRQGLAKILNKDNNFLIRYVKDVISYYEGTLSTYIDELGFIWSMDSVQPKIEEAFNLIADTVKNYLSIENHPCNALFKDIPENSIERANNFLMNYAKKYNNDVKKMNIVVDLTINSMKGLFDNILLQHVQNNQGVKIFSEIRWVGSSWFSSGGEIIDDRLAAKWKSILFIVESSGLGMKLIPIKKYINERIEACLASADNERMMRFLRKW